MEEVAAALLQELVFFFKKEFEIKIPLNRYSYIQSAHVLFYSM